MASQSFELFNSYSYRSNSEQCLHDAVCRLALVASYTFELFRSYSLRSNDSSLARNELFVAARQTKSGCDKLLSDAQVILRPKSRQSLIVISEKLDYFAQFFAIYSAEASMPQDLFIELRTRVGNVQYCSFKCRSTITSLIYSKLVKLSQANYIAGCQRLWKRFRSFCSRHFCERSIPILGSGIPELCSKRSRRS